MRALALALAFSLPSSVLAQAAPAAPPAARPVLGLDEAVRTALANHPQLRQAQANLDVASARSETARAPLLPQLKADLFYDWSTSNPNRHLTNPTGPTTSWTATRTAGAGATLTQVLFDAAQFQRYRSSLANTASFEAGERATELQIAASARAAFFAARAARDLVAVARDTLANQDAHLKQAQAFVEVGTRPEIDLASARAARANAAVQLIQAENGYDTARAQLAQAMGVERSTDFEVADDVLPAIPNEDQPLDPLYAEAIASRPELASFREQERAQVLTRSAARAGYLPTVGAQGDLSAQGPSLDYTYPNWSATITLTWNLFQGGATRAAIHESEATLNLITAQEEQLRQQIRLEVEQSRLAVRAARATLASAGEAETAAKEQLRLAEGRYRAGAGSIIELGDAQVAAANASALRVQSQFNLAASRAQLLRALGRPNP
ncbi:MAG TPA: TolC family protein [Anaeromyxobacter sp.]